MVWSVDKKKKNSGQGDSYIIFFGRNSALSQQWAWLALAPLADGVRAEWRTRKSCLHEIAFWWLRNASKRPHKALSTWEQWKYEKKFIFIFHKFKTVVYYADKNLIIVSLLTLLKDNCHNQPVNKKKRV